VARKDHRRGAVKKAVNSRQRTFDALAQSISRMDVDYNFELADHPNWMRALDRDTGKNPVDLEVNRRLDRAGKTRAQMNRVLAFQRREVPEDSVRRPATPITSEERRCANSDAPLGPHLTRRHGPCRSL
jgi:hypothetical protein